MTPIASGTGDVTRIVGVCGGVPVLVDLLLVLDMDDDVDELLACRKPYDIANKQH